MQINPTQPGSTRLEQITDTMHPFPEADPASCRDNILPLSLCDSDEFIATLDAAVEAHMDWSHKVLRCAVLRESPGDDVLDPQAHTLCLFSRWFGPNKAYFHELNPENTGRLEDVHKTMHDAIRGICTAVLAGQPGTHTQIEAYEQAQKELIELVARFKTAFLSKAAQRDPLTGLRLRFGMENDFIQIQKSCLRNNLLMYAAIIDIDHFKRVNDFYGHPIGDLALRHLADTLNHIVRPNEPLIRWGGEEFLLLIQCKEHAAAETAAERIVELVRSSPVTLEGGDSITLTVTMGLARVNLDESMASAVERADRALYAGKKAGRDRYVFAAD